MCHKKRVKLNFSISDKPGSVSVISGTEYCHLMFTNKHFNCSFVRCVKKGKPVEVFLRKPEQ